ncbi:MAG: ATP-binding cassette domain-containing protein [Hyphomicrobiales bacterium]|nr:ATP-binding cassette domain-containing protein [Hyphomicrobiales bacterium]
MLEVKGLRKQFFPDTPNARIALDGVDLSLAPGCFCIVIGSNGAGKSTLLNAIAGQFLVGPGEIILEGEDIGREPLHKRARHIARVFQDPMTGTAAGMSLEENLLLAALRADKRRFRFGLSAGRRSHFRERLALLGLGLENRLGDRIESLSGGQRQAVALVMAVLSAPKLLLLDEHMAALDPVTAALVLQATVRVVEEARLTTLMVTHNMRHALDVGDRLVMMDQGRIRLSLTRADKAALSVEDLVHRFREKDDRVLLAS